MSRTYIWTYSMINFDLKILTFIVRNDIVSIDSFTSFFRHRVEFFVYLAITAE